MEQFFVDRKCTCSTQDGRHLSNEETGDVDSAQGKPVKVQFGRIKNENYRKFAANFREILSLSEWLLQSPVRPVTSHTSITSHQNDGTWWDNRTAQLTGRSSTEALAWSTGVPGQACPTWLHLSPTTYFPYLLCSPPTARHSPGGYCSAA